MGRIGSTPIGEAFLPSISMTKLERLCRREKYSKAKLRLLSAILRKKGRTMGQIASELDIPVGTVHAWLRRLLEGGLEKLRDGHRSGRPRRLGVQELKQLRHDLIRGPKANGFDAPFWTTKMVIEHASRKYGKEYRARGMRYVLHRVGFSSRKPRPANAKRASKEEVESFKKRRAASSEGTPGRGSRSSSWTRRPST